MPAGDGRVRGRGNQPAPNLGLGSGGRGRGRRRASGPTGGGRGDQPEDASPFFGRDRKGRDGGGYGRGITPMGEGSVRSLELYPERRRRDDIRRGRERVRQIEYRHAQPQIIPIPVGGGGGMIHTVGGGGGQQQTQRGVAGGIKITNTQTVNERTRRKRAATKDKKIRKKRATKEYAKLRRQVQARIRAARSKEYKSMSKKIAKIPKGERASARKKARSALMSKQKEMFHKMKPASLSLDRLRQLLGKNIVWT